jgi:hypothetical protein
MGFANNSWALVKKLELGNKDFNAIKDTVFEDLKKECRDNREYLTVLGYAVHYLSVDPDEIEPNKNADIHVKRILDHVDAQRSDFSEKLSKASVNLRQIREVLEPKIQEILDGGDKEAGELMYAIYDSENNHTQSHILRAFETMSKDHNYESENSM